MPCEAAMPCTIVSVFSRESILARSTGNGAHGATRSATDDNAVAARWVNADLRPPQLRRASVLLTPRTAVGLHYDKHASRTNAEGPHASVTIRITGSTRVDFSRSTK